MHVQVKLLILRSSMQQKRVNSKLVICWNLLRTIETLSSQLNLHRKLHSLHNQYLIILKATAIIMKILGLTDNEPAQVRIIDINRNKHLTVMLKIVWQHVIIHILTPHNYTCFIHTNLYTHTYTYHYVCDISNIYVS